MIAPATDLQQHSEFQNTNAQVQASSTHQQAPQPVQSSETWNLQLQSCDAGTISEVNVYYDMIIK